MDILFDCAKNYEKLLNVSYHIIAGQKKDETIEFNITFKKSQFFHLFGLHKLTDTSLMSNYNKYVW